MKNDYSFSKIYTLGVDGGAGYPGGRESINK